MSYAFIHATVLDGTEKMKPMLDTTVLVDDKGKIVEVGPTAKVKMRGGEQIIDLQGKYLMPGLINMHVHLVGDGTPRSSSNAEGTVQKVTSNPVGMEILRHILKGSLKNQLASGVTTVRSVGDPGYADIQVRDQIKSGKFQGPRLIASGCGITVPEGHARLFAKKATTPEEGRALVHEHFSNGADQIKLFITGGVFDAEVEGEPGVLRMPLNVAQAVCDEAHKLGLRTSAHIESTEGVEVGLKAGVDTIEHGAPLTDELLKMFKKNGLGNASSLTCTLAGTPLRGAFARENALYPCTEGQRSRCLRRRRNSDASSACQWHSCRPGHRFRLPVCHALRHVARRCISSAIPA